jgi:hypothetical protein
VNRSFDQRNGGKRLNAKRGFDFFGTSETLSEKISAERKGDTKTKTPEKRDADNERTPRITRRCRARCGRHDTGIR